MAHRICFWTKLGRDGLDRCARECWILQSSFQPPNACAKADTPKKFSFVEMSMVRMVTSRPTLDTVKVRSSNKSIRYPHIKDEPLGKAPGTQISAFPDLGSWRISSLAGEGTRLRLKSPHKDLHRLGSAATHPRTASAPASHAGGCGFESRRSRQVFPVTSHTSRCL